MNSVIKPLKMHASSFPLRFLKILTIDTFSLFRSKFLGCRFMLAYSSLIQEIKCD